MKWLCIFMLCLLVACSANNQKLYEQKMYDLQMKIRASSYNALIDFFKEINGRFPESLNEVYLVYKQAYPEAIKQIEMNFFIDVFSKSKEWVGYFPIHDSSDVVIVSYVLLSAGIDGKLDNVYDPANKLHEDDWQQQFKLYNPNELDGVHSDTYIRSEYGTSTYPYNATDEKSGNKDLLIDIYRFLPKRSFP